MKPSPLLRVLARSHRWLGLGAALFVLWLAATGLLVNHAEDLGLARATVRSHWLLDVYRIGAPAVAAAYPAGEHWLVQADRSLYLDGRYVAALGDEERLLGAVELGESYAVATGTRLRLLDRDGAPVETIGPAHGLPGDLHRLGTAARGLLAVRTRDGVFAADPLVLDWRRGVLPVQWSEAESPPAALRTAIERDARTRVLTREQLVRDLHSGRLFGPWAKWLADLAALALVSLGVSGVWLWWRARQEFPGRAAAGTNGKPRG